MKEIRIGIIGCGGIAHAAHFPRYAKLEGVKLVAVADVNEDSARSAAETFGAESWYTDFRELTARDDIDAVSVTTPPKWHWEAAVAAANAGKHVLVEKPMARNVKEAAAMIKAAEENGVILMVTHHDRFDPLNIKIKSLIDQGAIGTPYEISLVGGDWHMVGSAWFYDKESAGGGIGMDGLIYTSYIWQYWMGPLASVYALADTHEKNHPVYEWHSDAEDDYEITATPDTTVEDSLGMLVRFKSGAVGVLYNTWVSPTSHRTSSVLGSNGLIELGGEDGPRIFLKEDAAGMQAGWHQIKPDGECDVYDRRAQHFVNCIRGDETPVTPGAEGAAAVEMIEAAYISVAEKRAVELPLQR